MSTAIMGLNHNFKKIVSNDNWFQGYTLCFAINIVCQFEILKHFYYQGGIENNSQNIKWEAETMYS